MISRSFISGGVTTVVLAATTLPVGAQARGTSADHRRATTARSAAPSTSRLSIGRLGRTLAAPPAVGDEGSAPTLVALPASPLAGERVRLILKHLPAGLRSVAWSLGDARPGSPPGARARLMSVVFASPGVHRVAVELIGASSSQSRAVFVSVSPRPRSASTVVTRTRSRVRRPVVRPLARATGDPAVSIADFHFTPAAITIHVGDTVTWSNTGPSSHTATARDGSFNTGTLARGASRSHAFAHAGTFAYFCSIHPFMHGTITVLAAASASPTPPRATAAVTATTPPTPAAAPVGSGPTLPRTGLALGQEIAVGLILVSLGLVIRSRPWRAD